MKVLMLKLSLKPGEYITLGDNIKIIFSGGSANNIHLLVDAPREINVPETVRAKTKSHRLIIKKKEFQKQHSVRLQKSSCAKSATGRMSAGRRP